MRNPVYSSLRDTSRHHQYNVISAGLIDRHDGTEQAYWFDELDVPLTHLLEPVFFENLMRWARYYRLDDLGSR